MRTRLLLGILLPLIVMLGIASYVTYQQAQRAAMVAYDRTLLASAKSIGELLTTTGEGEQLQVTANLLYAALEPFEADNRSRMFYKVRGFKGELVSGYSDFPDWKGKLPPKNLYPALIDFYDDHYQSEAVRVAVLLQPVATEGGLGMAIVQVAETIELRQRLARQILFETFWLYAVLVVIIAGVVLWVVRWATAPVLSLGKAINSRSAQDLSPIDNKATPIELRPLVQSTNHLIERLALVVGHQKKFVRNTAHQLRTPLAVLKVQVQSARRGDLNPAEALAEIEQTVDRATGLANQMLSLAKIEQLRQEPDVSVQDWDAILRSVALDLAPLIADHDMQFEITSASVHVKAHSWMLQELSRNLIHNAIKHSPRGGALKLELSLIGASAQLRVIDQGFGIPPELRDQLFQPFAVGKSSTGSGLGLTICYDICLALKGSLTLENQLDSDLKIIGLAATAQIPLH